MAATPITPSKRYFAPSARKFYYVATISNKNSPTRPELNAGTDLTGEIADASGWTVATNNVAAADYGSRFTAQVAGYITAADSSFTLYADSTSDDARTLLTRDLTGYVVVFPEGDASGNTLDVFPIKVTSVSKPSSNSEAATIVVNFAITSQPAVDIAVP